MTCFESLLVCFGGKNNLFEKIKLKPHLKFELMQEPNNGYGSGPKWVWIVVVRCCPITGASFKRLAGPKRISTPRVVLWRDTESRQLEISRPSSCTMYVQWLLQVRFKISLVFLHFYNIGNYNTVRFDVEIDQKTSCSSDFTNHSAVATGGGALGPVPPPPLTTARVPPHFGLLRILFWSITWRQQIIM